MVILKKIYLALFLVLLGSSFGCREVPVPKPRGHFRIDLPQKQYIVFDEKPGKKDYLPVKFEYPVYGTLILKQDGASEPGWFNIEFPHFKARIYLTYKDIRNNFDGLMEQTYRMNVKNHVGKADAINEKEFNNVKDKVYGILYDLRGNTATAVQFYVTDSTKHYLRGSLYFSSEPNADSLSPVIDFFREDIIHLIETLKWK
jgi:gliding motility-associated lipoprotein GldD